MNKIRRYADIEFRNEDNKEGRTVAGRAAVFNVEQDLGWYTEVIDEHALDGADMTETILNFNHNDDIVLAGVKNGSLILDVAYGGLDQQADIIDTTQGNDALKLVRAGLINKMSFAFTIAEDEWSERDGKDYRKILKIDKVYDVSLVVFPAYPQTYVGAMRKSEEPDELVKKHLLRKEQDKRMEAILNGKDFVKCYGNRED